MIFFVVFRRSFEICIKLDLMQYVFKCRVWHIYVKLLVSYVLRMTHADSGCDLNRVLFEEEMNASSMQDPAVIRLIALFEYTLPEPARTWHLRYALVKEE